MDKVKADEFVSQVRARTKMLMIIREIDIEKGVEHLTPAAEKKRQRYER